MWSLHQALQVVRAYVAALMRDSAIVLENSTIELPYGWVFFYQSRAWVETGDPLSLLAGNAPIIFNRVRGEYRITGTAHTIEHYLREYEASLTPYELHLPLPSHGPDSGPTAS